MAGTSKTNKIATLEDVTRRCTVGIAARASMLEEGILHARQARAQSSEAEHHFAAALAALNVVKPAFTGTSEYMLTSARLLGELTGDLETDSLELRSIQSVIAGLEEPMGGILHQFVQFSVEAISARIRGRMNKLGGDFAVPASLRPSVNLGQMVAPLRRRSESIPPRELAMSEIDEGIPMDNLVRAGLDNFERSAAQLEGCFDALTSGQGSIAGTTKELEALKRCFRDLSKLESGTASTQITEAVAELEGLVREVDSLFPRLERLSSAAERVRSPLLAIYENMGRLLVSSVLSEANPGESREISAKEILDRVLRGDSDAIAELVANADESKQQYMSDALYHAARTQELDSALYAIQGLRKLALLTLTSRSDASDNLVSLSNLGSIPEVVRSAATAALIDLTEGSGVSP